MVEKYCDIIIHLCKYIFRENASITCVFVLKKQRHCRCLKCLNSSGYICKAFKALTISKTALIPRRRLTFKTKSYHGWMRRQKSWNDERYHHTTVLIPSRPLLLEGCNMLKKKSLTYSLYLFLRDANKAVYR